ncbi:MAG: hypothetical protein ACRC8Y_11875 [Chroococcales cyanobacterium]
MTLTMRGLSACLGTGESGQGCVTWLQPSNEETTEVVTTNRKKRLKSLLRTGRND